MGRGNRTTGPTGVKATVIDIDPRTANGRDKYHSMFETDIFTSLKGIEREEVRAYLVTDAQKRNILFSYLNALDTSEDEQRRYTDSLLRRGASPFEEDVYKISDVSLDLLSKQLAAFAAPTPQPKEILEESLEDIVEKSWEANNSNAVDMFKSFQRIIDLPDEESKRMYSHFDDIIASNEISKITKKDFQIIFKSVADDLVSTGATARDSVAMSMVMMGSQALASKLPED